MHKNEILYNFFNSQNIKYNNMVVINSYLLYIYIYIYILEKIIIMIVLVYETIYFIITY